MITEPAQKCENNVCYFMQRCTLKLFVAFKIAYFVNSSGGNLYFIQNSFITNFKLTQLKRYMHTTKVKFANEGKMSK